MSPQDRKLERLLNLLTALLDTRRPLTRAEVVAKVPGYPDSDMAERKAFGRDVETLQAMGVPVEVTDDAVPAYRVLQSAYQLADPGLTGEEAAALHLALATVGIDLPEGSAEEALWKLTGGGGMQIEPPPALATLPGHEHLAAIWRATNDRRTLRFAYNDAEREVEPWTLSCSRGHWYLLGYDRLRGEERRFRLDRITGAPSVGDERDAFVRPDDRRPAGPPPPWLFGDEIAYAASVLVDAPQADLVRSRPGLTVIAERDDGSIVVSVPVAHVDGFRSFVLSLLDHAEVLGPPEARAAVVSWLEDVRG